MSAAASSIWSMSAEGRFNKPGRHAPKYLTPAQAARWERIVQARMLYAGEHYQYFVTERRTQYNFPDVLVDGGDTIKFYVRYNLLNRISNTSATLLFGREPVIRIDDAIQSDKLQALAARTDLHALLIETETECSFAGEAVLEACVFDGDVYVVQVPAEQIHPVGLLRPDRQYAAYVRYAEANVGTDTDPLTLVLQTTYREGSIERRLYQGTVSEANRVRLSEWPEFAAANAVPPDVQPTGLRVNTIVWLPNLMVSGRVLSDYDGGLLDLQDTLNAKRTQLARVLTKHADPKIVAPRAAARDDGSLPTDVDVLYADNAEDWRYLTWEAKLDIATKDMQSVEDAICVVSETAPVLLGIERGGMPESARAMRIRANPSLSKAERKASLRRPLLKWLLTVAQMLEQTIVGNRYELAAEPSVEPRDGLPTDDGELAITLTTLKQADLISDERAIELQISDPAAAEQELARIRKQVADRRAAEAANAPSVFGEPAAIDLDKTTADDTSTEAA